MSPLNSQHGRKSSLPHYPPKATSGQQTLNMEADKARPDESKWAKIEEDYWRDSRQARIHEDHSMAQKYDLRTLPMKAKLAELMAKNERLTRELATVRTDCELMEKEINQIDVQYEEAKQIVVQRRNEADTAAKGFFARIKTQAQRATSSHGDESTGAFMMTTNGTAAPSPASDDTEVEESIHNGQSAIESSIMASNESSPLSQPPDDIGDLTGAEVWDQDGRFISQVKRLNLDNRFVRNILQLPIQRRVAVRPGRRFSENTLESIYEPSDVKGAKWLSCMIQATGEEQEVPCTSCMAKSGTWDSCVIVGGQDFPRCANCEWNRQGCSGSSYHKEQSKDLDLLSSPPLNASDSPSVAGGLSREGSSIGGFTPVNGAACQKNSETPASAQPKRTRLPSKKGGRKSLPNMSSASKQKTESNNKSVTGSNKGGSVKVEQDPGPDITKETLHLRDNGVVFTEPEIMRGVPLERISPSHSYWEPHWEDVDPLINTRLAEWKEKRALCVEAGASRFLAGRQINRGNTTIEFLHNAPFHPYQLVSKRFISKSLISYDTVFRLAQVIKELPRLKIDCTPVEWVRERMHERYMEEGGEFNLAKTVHWLYHDPKLVALRIRNGFGNIGRPSGVKKGMTSRGGAIRPKNKKETQSKKRKRRDTTTSKPTLKMQDHNTPQATPATSPRIQTKRQCLEVKRSTNSQVEDVSPLVTKEPTPQAEQDGPFSHDGYTSTDSCSNDNISSLDWRIVQIKSIYNATNPVHTQYWHWFSTKDDGPCFEHQVLHTLKPLSWGVYKEPVDFHLRITELKKIEYSLDPDCCKLVMHLKPIPGIKYRGKLLVHLKRWRTLNRFLHFISTKLGNSPVVLEEKSSEYIKTEWNSIDSSMVSLSD